jgi:hypothetical protein
MMNLRVKKNFPIFSNNLHCPPAKIYAQTNYQMSNLLYWLLIQLQQKLLQQSEELIPIVPLA